MTDLPTVIATLRFLTGGWLQSDDDTAHYRGVADQLERLDPDDWGACPLCQEVDCDDGCPIAPHRQTNWTRVVWDDMTTYPAEGVWIEMYRCNGQTAYSFRGQTRHLPDPVVVGGIQVGVWPMLDGHGRVNPALPADIVDGERVDTIWWRRSSAR